MDPLLLLKHFLLVSKMALLKNFQKKYPSYFKCQRYFDLLPDEIVIHIFSYLPEQRHRSTCVYVCKRWLFIQSQMHSHDFAGCKKSKCAYCSHGKGRQSYFDLLPDELVIHIFSYLPEQRHRSTCACVCKRWLFIQSQMHFHDFAGCKKSKCAHCSYGKGLERSDHPWQDVDNMYNNKLVMESPFKAIDLNLASLAVGTRSKGGLEYLTVYGNGLTNNGIRAIGLSCSRLKSLALYRCVNLTDEGLESIALGCRSLAELRLDNCHAIGNAALFSISQSCVLLECFELKNCPFITNSGISAISNRCQNLSCFALDSCDGVDDAGLEAIASSCRKLSDFAVLNCRLIGNQGISAVVGKCKMLQVISLSSLKLEDDEFFIYLSQNSETVQSLILKNLGNITHRGIDLLRNSKFLVNFKSLVIIDCKGLPDSFFFKDEERWKRLDNPSLSSCQEIITSISDMRWRILLRLKLLWRA